MEEFRRHLQSEFSRRLMRNRNYSLRAFGQHLGVNHATLSSLLSGKRKITPTTVKKISRVLCLGPDRIDQFLSEPKGKKSARQHLLEADVFDRMSDWHYDAILELTLIPGFDMKADKIARALGISALQAKLAVEKLEGLGFLQKDESGRYQLQFPNSTNILDPDLTSSAQIKYQKSILQKSLEALETVDRRNRDHTSTTMAVHTVDLPKVKKLISQFRKDLNHFLQGEGKTPNEVYQLQVSFFPLSKLKSGEKTK